MLSVYHSTPQICNHWNYRLHPGTKEHYLQYFQQHWERVTALPVL